MNKSRKSSRSIFGLRPYQILLILFGISFLFRFIYLNQLTSSPLFQHPIMDESYHLKLAERIISGHGLPDEPYYRAPLYPYLLSFIYWFTGKSVYFSRLIQIILGSLLPILVYILGVRLFNKQIALIAGGIACFYPTFVYFDSSFLITSIMVLLTTLLVWQLYRSQDTGRLMPFVLAGLLLGLTALARPNILLLGPALIVWVWVVLMPKLGMKRAILSYAAIGLTCLAVIIPVTVRNYIVAKDLVFISWQGGINFYLGNCRDANGWSATASGMDATWERMYDESIMIPEADAKHKLLRSEISSYWYARAWRDIQSDVGAFIARLVNKARFVFNGFEIPNNQNIYMVRSFAPIIKPIMFVDVLYFPYGVLAPLALIGAGLSVRRWRKFILLYIFISAYAISVIVFFVCARYRQPLIPVLILFAAYAIYEFYRHIRSRNIKWILPFMFVLALLMLETNQQAIDITPKQLSSVDHFLLGNAYRDQHDSINALAEYQLSVLENPGNAFAYNNMGSVLRNQKRTDQAIRCYENAISADPRLYNPYLNLGILFMRMRNLEKATAVLENGCDAISNNDLLYLQLAKAYHQQNRLDDAKRALERCLQINPDNAEAQKFYQWVLKHI
jgi:4-amino-4-deoxy-L-arabinose transferase-like glycosyltransferase/Flp pilus assembly protein TadD